jgi:hypothetical protein
MKAYQVVNSSKQKQSGIKEAIMLDSMWGSRTNTQVNLLMLSSCHTTMTMSIQPAEFRTNWMSWNVQTSCIQPWLLRFSLLWTIKGSSKAIHVQEPVVLCFRQQPRESFADGICWYVHQWDSCLWCFFLSVAVPSTMRIFEWVSAVCASYTLHI